MVSLMIATDYDRDSEQFRKLIDSLASYQFNEGVKFHLYYSDANIEEMDNISKEQSENG